LDLHFREPLWLLAILLAIPLAWAALRSFQAMTRARAWSAVAARTTLIALIASMLAGAAAVRTTDKLAVIAVVDVSGSVRRFADLGVDNAGRRIPPAAAIRDWLAQATENRSREDLLGVVLFDAETMAVAAPAPPSAGQGPEGVGWSVRDVPLDISMAEGTNLGQALRFAAALVPPDAAGRLLVVSDGASTEGDALEAARAVGETTDGRLPIDVLPIAYGERREVYVEFVDAPPRAAREATVTVRIGLRATEETTGTLRLAREGRELDINGDAPGLGRRLTLDAGRRVELVEAPTPPSAIHRFRAFFEPDDPAADAVATNNEAEAVTVTPGRGSTLLLDGVGDGASPTTLARTLRRSGLDVAVEPPGALPQDLLSLQAYDLVILENVAADEVPRQAQRMLAEHVRDLGAGLIMVGGPDSFGAGGWNGTPIEAVTPVEMDLPERLIVPSAAIMLVLDSSGSMSRSVLGGSRSQQEIANESAALAIQTLDETDLVGVIAFDNRYRVVVPLAPNEDPQRSANLVRGIAPGGGTDLNPALFEAGRMLRDVEAKVKHIIVLSDGRSKSSPVEAIEIARRLADEGVSVSTIAVGDQADTQTLAQIAQRGGGQHYEVIDPNTLPRIFIREIRVVRKPMVREGRFTPARTGQSSPLLRGVPSPPPALLGLVLTQPRDEPTVVTALAAPGGEPVLAHWNVGLGKAAAWTSDAGDDWAAPWIEAPAYETLWSQMARAIARPPSTQQYDLTTEVVDGELKMRLEAFDNEGDPLDGLSVDGWLYPPSEERRRVRLRQTGPGVYEAAAPAGRSGSYVAAITPRRAGQALPPIVGGASRATGPEYRRLRSDVETLRRLAEVSGGRALSWETPSEAGLYNRMDLAPRRAMTPLWPTLLWWAIGVFLLDVATRRIAWDRLLTREFKEQLRQHADEAVRARSAGAAATIRELRGGKRARAAQMVTPAGDGKRSKAPGREARADSGVGLRRGGIEPPSDGEAAEAEEGQSSGLMAAKRRAAARYRGSGGESGLDEEG